MTFKMRFVDFPTEPNISASFFAEQVARVINEPVEIVQSAMVTVDLEIASNFIDQSLIRRLGHRLRANLSTIEMLEYENLYQWGFRSEYTSPTRARVWFTGENLRAPVGTFEQTFSCDMSDKLTKHTFFPYWFYRLKWQQKSNGYEFNPTPSELLAERIEEKRPRRACSFSSSREPQRVRVNRAIGQVLPLDEYGRAASRPVVQKKVFSDQYGFQVCTENDLYPNYVTEKLIEAWLSGNIPIWSGQDQLGFFNPSAIVDVTGMTSEQIQEKVSSITDDEAEYIRSQPILIRIPCIDEIYESLQRVISS
jgi:hypothetical protein